MRLRSIFKHVRVARNLRFLLARYKYHPLPTSTSIRLLELRPSPDKKNVHCSLKVFELHNAPSFQALSYTWGDPQPAITRPASTSSPSTRHNRASTFHSTPSQSATNVPRSAAHSEPLERDRRHSFVCDGQVLNVTSNLRDALRMLINSAVSPKATILPRYYWIDSVCMDQQNVLERNAQVAKMADIFKAAKSVVVWLGKEDEFTADALTAIERMSCMPEENWPLVSYTSFYETTPSSHHPKPNLSYHHWLGFIVLVNRPWFKRAWVVQEIAFAKSATIVCGTKRFPWEKLSKALAFIKKTRWYHHLHTEKMKHVAMIRKNPGIYKRVLHDRLSVGIGPVYLDATRLKVAASSGQRKETNRRPPLRMLLDTHRFSKSTDPRDKIYAFLGLADRKMAPFRSDPGALVPDYNMSVQQVYIDAACSLFKSYRNLSLLSHVQDSSQTRISGLPSWVPDYSVPLDPYPLRYRGPTKFGASRSAKWQMNTSSMAAGKLDVQGYQSGTIDQYSMLSNESDDPSASWASTVKLALSLDMPYPNPSKKPYCPSRVEILWRTMTTDTYNKTCPAPPGTGLFFIDYILNLQIRHRLTPWSSADDFQPHHTPLSELIYPEWNALLQLEPSDSPYSFQAYKERLSNVVESMFNGQYSPIGLQQLQHEIDQGAGRKRRLFKTRENFFGTGPRSLQDGDEIWILNGASVPFVLRRLPNGNHSLVGEAFVYGLMHGEFRDLKLPKHEITIE